MRKDAVETNGVGSPVNQAKAPGLTVRRAPLIRTLVPSGRLNIFPQLPKQAMLPSTAPGPPKALQPKPLPSAKINRAARASVPGSVEGTGKPPGLTTGAASSGGQEKIASPAFLSNLVRPFSRIYPGLKWWWKDLGGTHSGQTPGFLRRMWNRTTTPWFSPFTRQSAPVTTKVLGRVGTGLAGASLLAGALTAPKILRDQLSDTIAYEHLRNVGDHTAAVDMEEKLRKNFPKIVSQVATEDSPLAARTREFAINNAVPFARQQLHNVTTYGPAIPGVPHEYAPYLGKVLDASRSMTIPGALLTAAMHGAAKPVDENELRSDLVNTFGRNPLAYGRDVAEGIEGKSNLAKTLYDSLPDEVRAANIYETVREEAGPFKKLLPNPREVPYLKGMTWRNLRTSLFGPPVGTVKTLDDASNVERIARLAPESTAAAISKTQRMSPTELFKSEFTSAPGIPVLPGGLVDRIKRLQVPLPSVDMAQKQSSHSLTDNFGGIMGVLKKAACACRVTEVV